MGISPKVTLMVIYATGFGGQGLYVIPSLQLICVITSNMDKPHTENKLLVKEFVKMITSDRNKEAERNEKIGIIAAEKVLEFFTEDLGTFIYNKTLDETKLWFAKRMEDIETVYFHVIKES